MERDDVGESVGPTTIGKYQLFASLGRGGMADVYLAIARGPIGFNKLTVIKRLRSDIAPDPSLSDMLLDEARLAARLSHPNVIHTYEAGEDNGAYFIAMEYLEGQPLVRLARTAAKSGARLEAPLSARIVADALAGLHYAHELRDYDGKSLQIIHRDVSPHNIFVTYDGVVKLMDFGIAKATSSAAQTDIGVVKGKLAYMSPEQVTGETVDRRADIFSMGVVLWELLTSERLFNTAVAASAIHKLASQPIPRVSEKVFDVDAGLDAIVAKALEKNAANRYQTAQEMRAALEEYVERSGARLRPQDVGERVSDLFEGTRENVHRQIQMHMAEVSLATNSEELQQFNARALERGAHAPSPSGRNLLTFDRRDASGSEIIPAASHASISSVPSPRSKRVGAWIGGAALGVALAGVLFVSLHARRPMASAVALGGDVSRPREPAVPSETVLPLAPPPSVSTMEVASAVVPAHQPSAPSSPAGPVAPVRREASRTVSLGPAAPAPVAPAAPTKSAASASAVPDAGTGYLTLDTYPWSRVSENGRVLGVTPLVHVPLSAGSHVLTLENPDQGLKQDYPISLKADEAISRRLGLK